MRRVNYLLVNLRWHENNCKISRAFNFLCFFERHQIHRSLKEGGGGITRTQQSQCFRPLNLAYIEKKTRSIFFNKVCYERMVELLFAETYHVDNGRGHKPLSDGQIKLPFG